jgi:hypothetical protein
MAARVRCKASVVNDEKEESNVREQAQAVMVVVVAGDVRRFGGDAMRCCVLQQPVYSSARALDDANDFGSSLSLLRLPAPFGSEDLRPRGRPRATHGLHVRASCLTTAATTTRTPNLVRRSKQAASTLELALHVE